VYLIHERVDEGVGDVIGEVEIEDDEVGWNETENHEERRKKRDDKDDRYDEQHDGRLEVRHQSSIRLRLRRFLLLRPFIGTLLHDNAMLSLVSTDYRSVNHNNYRRHSTSRKMREKMASCSIVWER